MDGYDMPEKQPMEKTFGPPEADPVPGKYDGLMRWANQHAALLGGLLIVAVVAFYWWLDS